MLTLQRFNPSNWDNNFRSCELRFAHTKGVFKSLAQADFMERGVGDGIVKNYPIFLFFHKEHKVSKKSVLHGLAVLCLALLKTVSL